MYALAVATNNAPVHFQQKGPPRSTKPVVALAVEGYGCKPVVASQADQGGGTQQRSCNEGRGLTLHNMVRGEFSLQIVQLLGAELGASQVLRQVQAKVQVLCPALAHLGGQRYGQRAHDHVTRLHGACIKVRHKCVHGKALLAGPMDGTGVAGDEVTLHRKCVV